MEYTIRAQQRIRAFVTVEADSLNDARKQGREMFEAEMGEPDLDWEVRDSEWEVLLTPESALRETLEEILRPLRDNEDAPPPKRAVIAANAFKELALWAREAERSKGLPEADVDVIDRLIQKMVDATSFIDGALGLEAGITAASILHRASGAST